MYIGTKVVPKIMREPCMMYSLRNSSWSVSLWLSKSLYQTLFKCDSQNGLLGWHLDLDPLWYHSNSSSLHSHHLISSRSDFSWPRSYTKKHSSLSLKEICIYIFLKLFSMFKRREEKDQIFPIKGEKYKVVFYAIVSKWSRKIPNTETPMECYIMPVWKTRALRLWFFRSHLAR